MFRKSEKGTRNQTELQKLMININPYFYAINGTILCIYNSSIMFFFLKNEHIFIMRYYQKISYFHFKHDCEYYFRKTGY